MLKHIFFDMDKTLTPSKALMSPTHQPLFADLCTRKDVVVVTGQSDGDVRKQIPVGQYFLLTQTGNHAIDKSGQTLWQETFTDEQTAATLKLIETIKKELNLAVTDDNDLVELRGSQISYSPIGHHEELEKKYAFDPKTELRRKIINEHASEVAILNDLNVDVVPGGTTCFDFFLKGKNKGYNVTRLIENEGWEKQDCVYVGDALFPGGNDETVIGVIQTHPVKDPNDTFAWVKSILTS